MARKPWTPDEIERLKALYPDAPTARVAEQLGRTVSATNGMAAKLRLHKSPAYLASPDARRLDGKIGMACRFQKGHVPANKGLRRPGHSPGRMAETQFRKGSLPHNYKPLGSERIVDGYLQRKMTDTGYPPRDWVPVHVLLWREHNGPVPEGHILRFRNGDRTDIRIENLELITRRQNIARNTIHNLPEPLVEVIRLKGALKRRITCMERKQRDEREHD